MLKLEWIFKNGKCVSVRWVKHDDISQSNEDLDKAS